MLPESQPETGSRTRSDTKKTLQFVGFEIEGQHYAFPIERIREIVILEHITPTPRVAGCVDGVSNLRGEIIPIVNLRKLLGMEPRAFDSETRIIVVNAGRRTMGCTVDAVTQVIRIPVESIQEAPEALTGGDAHDVAGFAKLDDRVVILLNLDELLDSARLMLPGQEGRPTSHPSSPQ